jgi:hypothetical protein
MKVVFLDVDGVLNNFDLIRTNGFDYIDGDMVRRLGLVISQTQAYIVLSSYWRLSPKDRVLVDQALKEWGMFIHDRTPHVPGPRYVEISQWLGENPEVGHYAILDDDEDAGVGMETSFFQTDPEIGITFEIAKKVIAHLNGEEDE